MLSAAQRGALAMRSKRDLMSLRIPKDSCSGVICASIFLIRSSLNGEALSERIRKLE